MKMKRALAPLLLLLAASGIASAAPLAPEQREASIRYIRSLQNPDGGFRAAAAPGASSVGATSSSLRALKYLGGGRGSRATEEWLMKSVDPATGGMADTPGGAPDVRSTAVGVMALVELRGAQDGAYPMQVKYLDQNAKALPDIYIAAAALDSAKIKPAKAPEWRGAWEGTRNADGTYGKGIADTAGAAITVLRLGGEVKDRAGLARTLKAAQRPDGGFSATADTSDLSTVYRVMRALWMLKEKPELEPLRAFVARCRNVDGGYGPAPGQPSNASATYFASIVLHWADELSR